MWTVHSERTRKHWTKILCYAPIDWFFISLCPHSNALCSDKFTKGHTTKLTHLRAILRLFCGISLGFAFLIEILRPLNRYSDVLIFEELQPKMRNTNYHICLISLLRLKAFWENNEFHVIFSSNFKWIFRCFFYKNWFASKVKQSSASVIFRNIDSITQALFLRSSSNRKSQ